jgi:hypothetical protein
MSTELMIVSITSHPFRPTATVNLACTQQAKGPVALCSQSGAVRPLIIGGHVAPAEWPTSLTSGLTGAAPSEVGSSGIHKPVTGIADG